jgi:hypothetical protein
LAPVLSIVSTVLVGLILVVAPWTGLWESNFLILPHPTLRAWLLNAFVRGAVTGLGLVNFVLAAHEMVQQIRGSRPHASG